MIPHNKPTLGPSEEQAATGVLRSGWVAQGREVQSLEDEFCALLGLPPGHAVAVSSGTAALFLALWALGARGKSVALPAYACSALRHAAAMAGGREAFFDVAEGSPNVDLAAVASAGVDLAVVVHMYGLPADVRAAGVPVVEDCAQALGAAVDGEPVGLRGRLGIYSFYATKLVTTGGQGGMVVSKDRALVDAIRDYRQFDGRRDDRRRFNFQLTDLQAAVGRAQLRRLPEFLARRAALFERYRAAGLPLLWSSVPGNVRPVRYRAVLETAKPAAVLAALAARGVKAIVPLEDWELLGAPGAAPRALALTRRTVSLPLYPSLEDAAADAAVAAVRGAA